MNDPEVTTGIGLTALGSDGNYEDFKHSVDMLKSPAKTREWYVSRSQFGIVKYLVMTINTLYDGEAVEKTGLTTSYSQDCIDIKHEVRTSTVPR